MNSKDAEFLKRLKATFRIEAEEHVHAISAGLIELEKGLSEEERTEIIEQIFREAHSLKGAARSVDQQEIESVCQPLEGVFSTLKRQQADPPATLYDLCHQAVDTITQWMEMEEEKPSATQRKSTKEIIEKLTALSVPGDFPKKTETTLEHSPLPQEIEKTEEPPPPPPEPPAESVHTSQTPTNAPQAFKEGKVGFTDTVRIPTARLDALLLQAEEMVSAKVAVAQRIVELQELRNMLNTWKKEGEKWNKRFLMQDLPQAQAWKEWHETHLNALDNQVGRVTQAIEQDQRVTIRMVDEQLERAKSAVMLPVALLVESFPKLVRDLAHDQKKDVALFMEGTDIELDKRILEGLKDPLVHLLRNCIDHGIERPEERKQKSKDARGKIHITFSTKGSRQVEVLVADDGAGIDIEKIRTAIHKKRPAARREQKEPDSKDPVSLIFESGISTSPFITDISGRGLGLAIVREKVEKLGGSVAVETKPESGAVFRLHLPLTLATFRGVLLRIGEYQFIAPTMQVECALNIHKEEIETVENHASIQVGGRILSLVNLSEVLGLPNHARDAKRKVVNEDSASLSALVLVSGKKRMAFLVDEILAEQQVMVKDLGKQLRHVRNIAGATVLGSGEIAPVLNVADLIESAEHMRVTAPPPSASSETEEQRGRLLVAEDSITARTLLKNVLEMAGYEVTTAVDGADAFMQVRSAAFDLVVSDVDMPRMSGFELTQKIRHEKHLSELPVILVTALDSREDREHGIDVGANAYIVKSSFEQSNLLEVIQQLL